MSGALMLPLPRQLAGLAPQFPALFSGSPQAAKGFVDFFTAKAGVSFAMMNL